MGGPQVRQNTQDHGGTVSSALGLQRDSSRTKELFLMRGTSGHARPAVLGRYLHKSPSRKRPRAEDVKNTIDGRQPADRTEHSARSEVSRMAFIKFCRCSYSTAQVFAWAQPGKQTISVEWWPATERRHCRPGALTKRFRTPRPVGPLEQSTRSGAYNYQCVQRLEHGGCRHGTGRCRKKGTRWQPHRVVCSRPLRARHVSLLCLYYHVKRHHVERRQALRCRRGWGH